jgi:hypothetical protein
MTLAKSTDSSMSIIEQVLVMGDLARLNPEQRNQYYRAVCESLGLNPLTRPFEYITLNGKLQLYARKDCTDQLRKIHGVSIRIAGREVMDDLMVVTAEATDKSGRTDSSIGAVSIAGLRGEAKANALMKAETKSRRRVTLALCGLGMLDESELDGIPNPRLGEPQQRSADRIVAKPVAKPVETPAEPKPGADAPAEPAAYSPEPPPDGYLNLDVVGIEEHKGKSGGSVWKVTTRTGAVLACLDPVLVQDLSDIRENCTIARCEVQRRGNRTLILSVQEVQG